MDLSSQTEEKNKKRGMVTSITIHIGLVLLALLPMLTFPDPPPGQEGILVNLGLPDVGEGDENAGPAPVSEPLPETKPVEKPVEAKPEPVKETVKETKKPEPVKEKEVIKTEDPAAVALRKKQEQAAAEKKRQEELAEQQRQAEAARKKAEAEAQAKKEQEAQALKDLLSGGLSGSGSGKGNTGKPGNQGDPGGDPDASKLEGISSGSGSVGGGLGDRGVRSAPQITDNSQQQGTVVVRVCVDKAGNVTSAEFTQRGSTISDSRLKNIAVENAKRWKFSPGTSDEQQCGTITYRFQVR